MTLKAKIYLLVAILIVGVYLKWSNDCLASGKFVYESSGKRDPFVPLLDQESPSGLRSVFIAPDAVISLPFEVKIEGIVWNGQEYFTVINKQVIKKGENLGKVKIKEIEADKVILEYGQREFPIFLRKEKAK